MSKSYARGGQRLNKPYRKSARRRKIALAVGIVLCLALTGLTLARWRTTLSSAALAPPQPQASPMPSLSKEYIYAGGRLVAIEEPTPSPTPPPITTEAVFWMNMVGTSASPTTNSLTKTSTSGWNAGAISTKAIVSGNGYIEFTAGEAKNKAAGLANGDSGQDFDDIAYAFILSDSGGVYIYESGNYRGYLGAYSASTVFRVAVESNVVKYYKGGALVYTSNVVPSYPLLVDTGLCDQSSTIQNVMLNGSLQSPLPTEPVLWTNISPGNLTASQNNLTKTGAAGWNAGAVSNRAIASGNGYVEFTTNEAKNKVCGLSRGNTNYDMDDIDYAFYLSDGNGTTGGVYIYESGIYKGYYGSYGAGTIFRVAMESSWVKYYRNGVLLYSHAITTTPIYPLLVDTALADTGATIQNVVLGGALQNAP